MSITKAARVLALALVAAFVPASAFAGTFAAAPAAQAGARHTAPQMTRGKTLKLKTLKGAKLGAKATKGGAKVAPMKVTKKKVIARGR